MKLLKGFISIQQLISNQPGVTAILGELSPLSRTYSREVGEYTNPDVPGYTLHTMHCVDSEQVGQVPATDTTANLCINIARSAFVYGRTNQRPLSSEDFVNTLLVDYYGAIANLEIGRFIDNGEIQMPEWISWTVGDAQGIGGEYCKIWLCDASFADQYDEYEILVIPPVPETDLDALFGPFTVVQTKLNAVSNSEKMENIQIAKNGHPETIQKLLEFSLVNPAYSTSTLVTQWNLLIYGIAGANIDAMKDAITDYIALHTTHQVQDWENLIPELYKRTEFVLLPRWDKFAIPDMDVMEGLYSAMISAQEAIAYAKSKIDFYVASHIEQNTTLVPYDYKNVTVVIVNGSANIAGKETIQQVQPDYISVPTTSPDFNRMTIKTQEWSLMVEKMLMVAEKMDKFTSVPRGMRKVYRQGKLYLTSVYDGVNYLMAPKRVS